MKTPQPTETPGRSGKRRKKGHSKWGYVIQEATDNIEMTAEQRQLVAEYTAKKEAETAAFKLREETGEAPEAYTETTTLHISDGYDYQGRSFLHPPQTEGVRYGTRSEHCYLPKRMVHTWTAHSKGVSAVRLFPVSAHLILSCGLDSQVKLWEMYGSRRLVRTYTGHTKAARDICFNVDGSKFVSCGYDRKVRLWDTETGKCVRRFSNRKVPYCVKFHPHFHHLIAAGTSGNKVVCWDTNTGDTVQTYDRHMGPVNTITFVEGGRRMVTTSDDKSLRVWEWDIPVDIKYIADPSMHSMPSVALSPDQRWMVCQSMNNKIMTFSARNKFRQNRKKVFKGHLVAGYACEVNFSPDGRYVLSGDAEGKLNIWDWKTAKRYKSFRAHDKVCIGCVWNPNTDSDVVTCGWDGKMKLWSA